MARNPVMVDRVTNVTLVNDVTINLEFENPVNNDLEIGQLNIIPDRGGHVSNTTVGQNESNGNQSMEGEDSDSTCDKFIVQETVGIENPVAANDMRIVGEMWANDEVTDEVEEEFSNVLSRSQKKKLKGKGQTEKVYHTRRGAPDFVCPRVWDDLKLKLFVVNNNGNKLPSLWGPCKSGLNPIVMANSYQHIAISIDLDSKSMFIVVVYANIKHKLIRAIWSELYVVIHTNPGHWCCLGDFNVVLGAHECRSSSIPGRLACAEICVASTEKRLNRLICNKEWVDNWNQVSCYALPRLFSDHHPLLVNSTTAIPSGIAHFRFFKMWLQDKSCKELVATI
ncbi:hypothetical protein Lal_00022852 [Lupinus albus]|nr:hypothetical protein Lal_00022852 [Lupinus albus]